MQQIRYYRDIAEDLGINYNTLRMYMQRYEFKEFIIHNHYLVWNNKVYNMIKKLYNRKGNVHKRIK